MVSIKVSQKLVGDLGIHFFDSENKQVEIGCTMNKSFQNKGYATESMKSIIDFLFKELNKHRIITSIDPDNKTLSDLSKELDFEKKLIL